MTAKFSSLLLLLILSLYSFGQETTKQNLFLTGIYLDNLNVAIPWETDYKKIISFGNPIADTFSNGDINFKWDAVRILGDISINLRLHVSRNQIRKSKPLQVITFSGVIDISDIERIKKYLKDYTNSKGSCYDYKNESVCYWKINGCNIRVGRWKSGGFFGIQKLLPKQNGI
jgi:hypothetical protein